MLLCSATGTVTFAVLSPMYMCCTGRVSSVRVQAQQSDAMSSVDRLSYDKVCPTCVAADHDVMQNHSNDACKGLSVGCTRMCTLLFFCRTSIPDHNFSGFSCSTTM